MIQIQNIMCCQGSVIITVPDTQQFMFLNHILTRSIHDDTIKWKRFSYYWPFVQGIHQSLVNLPSQKPVTLSFDVSDSDSGWSVPEQMVE